MTFLAIVFGFVILIGCFGFFFATAKKILEIISMIIKVCIFGMVSVVIAYSLNIEFKNSFLQMLFFLVGGVSILYLVSLMASRFRLVGYSINYFNNAFALLVLAMLLKNKIEIPFIAYLAAMFLLPRVIWISDRFATTQEYSHSEHDFWTNTTTDYYSIKETDWWADSEKSWKWLPLQIVLSIGFYTFGSVTALFQNAISSDLVIALFLLASTVGNIVFDIFVFQRIEKKLAEKHGL